MSILSILNEIADVGSTTEKQRILESHRDNLLLKDIFRLTYDNSYNFYIKKLPTDLACVGSKDLPWAFDQLSVLYTRAKTGHAGIAHLTYVLNSLTEDDAEVICRIISRDLACGCATTIPNKVWDNLIPDLPIMLAQPMKDKFIAKIKYPAVAQLKADGARCISVISEDVQLFSRNYKGFSGLDDICDFLVQLRTDLGRFVLDGELVCVDHLGKALPRKTSNGIINKASKGTISKAEAASVRYKVWDVIPYDDYFIEGIHKTPYLSRYEDLVAALSRYKSVLVFPIESFIVNNLEDAKTIFQKYVTDGEEGIILKNIDAPWENKRSNNQVKFKVEIMSDFIVDELIEGQGKYVGMLGALSVSTRCGKLKTNVGSGFNDEDRQYYWEHPEEIVGKVVEVKHNGVIQSKGKDTASVFLPIFQYVRDDKEAKDADTLESIDG